MPHQRLAGIRGPKDNSENLPFPKTHRIVFHNNKPATLQGWVELTVE